MKNSKLIRIKETLKSVLSQFEAERITSDKGVLDVQKAGDKIAVDDTVMAVDENGVESQVENGDYTLTDGTILRIADGKITEIVEPEEEKPEEVVEEPAKNEEFSKICAEKFESYEERERKIYEAIRDQKGIEGWLVEAGEDYAVISVWNGDSEKNYRYPYAVGEDGAIVVGDGEEVELAFVPAEEEVVVEEPVVEEPVVVEEPKPEENFEDVENPTNEGEESDTEAVVELRKEVNELYEKINKLEEEIEKLKNEPAAKPATEEFERINKIGKTGNEKLDNLARFCKK